MSKTKLILLITVMFSGLSHAACNVNVSASAPNDRYTVNSDGTIRDDDTKLVWMRCSVGQTWNGSGCSGNPASHSWQSALNTAYDYEFADKSDWRLPDIKELSSLIEQQCYNPSINENMFPDTPAEQYWTSSPYASSARYGWNVSFYLGYNHHNFKTDEFFIRLVRSADE